MKIFWQEEFRYVGLVEITEICGELGTPPPELPPEQEFAIGEQDEDAASDTAPAYNCQIDLFE